MAKTPTDANAISESGEGRALAEAGRNQVSDRRDVVGPDDRHQPLQERQAEQQHQRRTQVDRNAGPAVAHGGAHGTEERPRRAIDAEGQAVDPRPQARVTRVHRTTLVVKRDAEQHQQLADGERRTCPALAGFALQRQRNDPGECGLQAEHEAQACFKRIRDRCARGPSGGVLAAPLRAAIADISDHSVSTIVTLRSWTLTSQVRNPAPSSTGRACSQVWSIRMASMAMRVGGGRVRTVAGAVRSSSGARRAVRPRYCHLTASPQQCVRGRRACRQARRRVPRRRRARR